MTIQYRRMAQTSTVTYPAIEVTFSPSVPVRDRSEIAQKVSEYRKAGVPPQDGDIIAVGNSDNDGAAERHYRLVAYSGGFYDERSHSQEETLCFQVTQALEFNDEKFPLALIIFLGAGFTFFVALAGWLIVERYPY